MCALDATMTNFGLRNLAAVVVGKGSGGKPPPPAIYIKDNFLSSKQL